jgi:putative acetyltransferase
LIIRQEKPYEFQAIYDLVRVAFQTAKVSNDYEQNYVDKLRSSGSYIPELALAAEENAELVGHIMLAKTYVVTGSSKFDALLLAPLSVALEYRKRGVGANLVMRSFELARDFGFKAVFVVGDRAFYGRFGFKSTVLFGTQHFPQIPEQYVMVYELSLGALNGVNGTVTFT